MHMIIYNTAHTDTAQRITSCDNTAGHETVTQHLHIAGQPESETKSKSAACRHVTRAKKIDDSEQLYDHCDRENANDTEDPQL